MSDAIAIASASTSAGPSPTACCCARTAPSFWRRRRRRPRTSPTASWPASLAWPTRRAWPMPTPCWAECASIVHGTTAADNTMIQMTGRRRPACWSPRASATRSRCVAATRRTSGTRSYPAPEPIARRRVRLEIAERLTARATSTVALDEEGVRKATARLRAFGVTSIAVCFLHSLPQPGHELRAREIILDEYPDVELISLSHEVCPKPPEFERTSTTLVNAFVGPPIVRYLDRLEARLQEAGFAGGAPPRHQLGRRGHPDGRSEDATARHDQLGADRRCGGGGGCGRGGRTRRRRQRRHGRHELRRLPDPRRAAGGEDATGTGGTATASPCRWSTCTPSAPAADRSAATGHGSLTVGPESAGSDPGPGVLRARRNRAHRDRRRPGAGPPRPRRRSGAAGSTSTSTAARPALAAVGKPLGLDAEETAVATIAIIDAHMCDAVRRVLSLAGADAARARPRRLRRHGCRARGPPRRAARHAPGPHSPRPLRPSPPSACSPPITSSTRRARCRGTGGRSTSDG